MIVDQVRLLAYLRVRQMAAALPFPFVEGCMKRLYLAFAKRARAPPASQAGKASLRLMEGLVTVGLVYIYRKRRKITAPPPWTTGFRKTLKCCILYSEERMGAGSVPRKRGGGGGGVGSKTPSIYTRAVIHRSRSVLESEVYSLRWPSFENWFRECVFL